MKRIVFTGIGAALLVGLWAVGGRSAVQDKEAKLMRRKLEQSQKILEGVALSDFKKIEQHAVELIEISRQAEWRALKTPQYQVYSNDFRRTASNLVDNAKKKNIDAATLSYVELTLTCVKCHKHVREVRMANLD